MTEIRQPEPPSVLQEITDKSIRFYFLNLRRKEHNRGPKWRDPEKDPLLAEHRDSARTVGISVADKRDATLYTVRGALDTIEPQDQPTMIDFWSTRVAEHTIPFSEHYGAEAIAVRQQALIEQARAEAGWLRRSIDRTKGIEELDAKLQFIMSQYLRASNTPPVTAESLKAAALQLESQVAELPLTNEPPRDYVPVELTKEEEKEIAARLPEWGKLFLSHNLERLLAEFLEIRTNKGPAYFDKAIVLFQRNMAESRLTYPMVLFQLDGVMEQPTVANPKDLFIRKQQEQVYLKLQRYFAAQVCAEMHEVSAYLGGTAARIRPVKDAFVRQLVAEVEAEQAGREKQAA